MRPAVQITRDQYLADRHGKKFADVLEGPGSPFEAVLAIFHDAQRQQGMEDTEIHHVRAPLAGAGRGLESEPAVGEFVATSDRRHSTRLPQSIGLIVRLIMERRGWHTTGKKGSLGLRRAASSQAPESNTGGLAEWFLRAERHQRAEGMPYDAQALLGSRAHRASCRAKPEGRRSRTRFETGNTDTQPSPNP